MAVAVTQVGRRTVFGDRRVGFYDVAFSGNYATGGEAVTAALFGLNDIDYISSDLSPATNGATADVVAYKPTSGAGGSLFVYESGAANAPLAEKNNGEAYLTGETARLMVVGH